MRQGLLLVASSLIWGALCLPPELPAASGNRISCYETLFLPHQEPGNGVAVAIRRYVRGGAAMALVLDPRHLTVRPVPWSAVQDTAPAENFSLAATPFGQCFPAHPPSGRAAVASPRAPLSLFLTIDLCPSRKALDRTLFQLLFAEARGRPFPVGLAAAGSWIRSHPKDLAWLRAQEHADKLAVTWINHTATHPFRPGVPAAQNFLRLSGVDARQEILRNEILFLEAGVPLSPFFRFPGLIATEALHTLLASLSLISVDSDAWLAKGENPQPGDILLVHGNGNEPGGVNALKRFLQSDWPSWKDRGVRFCSLPEAFGAETNGR